MSNTPRVRRRQTPGPASLAESYAADYRCQDCHSETELFELAPGVFRLDVRHDETCPTLRRMEGR